MNKDVSIIIINYRTPLLLCNTVNSVVDKTKGINYEIIVVDNNSNDGSSEVISENVGKYITFLQLSENIGFGRANNEGLKVASGRNILFLNPDTLLVNNAIKILSDFMDNNPKCGACGGNLYFGDMTPGFSFGMMFYSICFDLNRFFFNIPALVWYGRNMHFNYTDKNIKVAHIVGADLMTRKEILNRIDGFDPDFFMFCEETELCFRIKKDGHDIYNVPKAQIIHLEGKSFDVKSAREIMQIQGRSVYFRKTQRKINYYIANVFSLLSLINRLLFYLFFFSKKKIKLYSVKIWLFISNA